MAPDSTLQEQAPRSRLLLHPGVTRLPRTRKGAGELPQLATERSDLPNRAYSNSTCRFQKNTLCRGHSLPAHANWRSILLGQGAQTCRQAKEALAGMFVAFLVEETTRGLPMRPLRRHG